MDNDDSATDDRLWIKGIEAKRCAAILAGWPMCDCYGIGYDDETGDYCETCGGVGYVTPENTHDRD
jgi:hypothetical protein